MDDARVLEMGNGVRIPEGVLGRERQCGTVTVTADMVAAYARAVGDAASLHAPLHEAPPTFCLALRRGFTPDIVLPEHLFGMHGGHDLEFCMPIRVGGTYRVSARITDVYEKSGRSGPLVVVVREAVIRDARGRCAARIVDRQIIRARPAGATAAVPE
jgi:acyl dehydratase